MDSTEASVVSGHAREADGGEMQTGLKVVRSSDLSCVRGRPSGHSPNVLVSFFDRKVPRSFVDPVGRKVPRSFAGERESA